MRLTIKILKLFLILAFTVSILLFAASLLLQDKVADIVLKSLNKNISTKLDIGSFRLSFLRKFPKASLQLKDVVVLSSADFNTKDFPDLNTDTLLTAKSMSVEFKITNIIRGIYNIDRIGAKDGYVRFFIDHKGRVNYNISSKNSSNTEGEPFTLDLDKIYLTNFNASYKNLSVKLDIEGLIDKGTLKSRISGSNVDFTALADMKIYSFQLLGTRIDRLIAAEIDLTLQSSKTGFLFKKGTMTIDNYDFGLKGTVSTDNVLDLNVSGNNLDISKIRNYFPEKYNNLVQEYNPSGLLNINGKIKGLLSAKSDPHVEIGFNLKKGQITYGNSNLSIKDLSFTGQLTNGLKNSKKTSTVAIKDIKAKLGSSDYEGSLTVSHFDAPESDLWLKGTLHPDELKEFFNLKDITKTEGTIDADLRLVTDFWPKGKVTFSDVAGLKPEGDLIFSSFTIGLAKNNFLVENVNGTMQTSKSIMVRNLSFRYKDQNIKVTGEFKNLPEWLAGKNFRMIAAADVLIDRLNTEVFFKEASSSGKSPSKKTALKFPEDILLDINFKIDSLEYRKFASSDIVGTLNYKPKLLTFTSLKMKSLEGLISGNGFIVQNKIKSLIVRGTFDVENINVKKAFISFNDFGQSFLKAGNIDGALSGTLIRSSSSRFPAQAPGKNINR